MARRLTKEEQRLLEEQELDLWLEQRFAEARSVPFRGSSPIPAGYSLEEEVAAAGPEEASPFREQLGQALLRDQVSTISPFMSREAVDSVLGLAGTGLQSAGALVDAIAPDINPLALQEGEEELSPFTYARSALENVRDVGAAIPALVGNVSEWAGIPRETFMPVWAGDASGQEQAARARAATDADAARTAAGLPSSEEMRGRALPNRLADVLYGVSDDVREGRSQELQAAQEHLGQSIEGGPLSLLRGLASEQGARALFTGVIPESAAYAAQGYGVGALGRAAQAPAALSSAAANTTLAYTIAQQNANEVEEGIMSLSPAEAMQNPQIAAEYQRTGDIDQAKATVARIARQQTITASAAISPLYGLDVFSRSGAGVRAPLTATLQRQVGGALVREGGGEFLQEAGEALAADFGNVAGGQLALEEAGQSAVAQGMLGTIASAPLAGGMSYAQASSEFSQRADALQDRAARERAVEALLADIEAGASRDAVDVRPDVSRADPEDSVSVDREPIAPSELRTAEQAAADEAARLALSGIPAPEQPTQAPSAVRPLNRDDQEIINRRLLALGETQSDAAQAEAVSQARPEGVDEARGVPMRDRGRFTGQRSGQVPVPSPAADALTRDAQRLADSLVAEQQEQAQEADAQRDRGIALEEAAAFDQQEQERGDTEARKRLAAARGQRTRERRAAMAAAREDNVSASPEVRAAAIADAAAEFDAANPEPTLESLPPVQAPRRRSRARPIPTTRTPAPRPGAAPAQPADVAELSPELETEPLPQDRREALRAHYGRAQEGEAAPAGRSAADVLEALAERVRRGTDRSALEADALLANGKLDILNPADMANVQGATENTEGYYDGERMYINAASLPSGDPVGVLFNSVLAHEANHAATSSQNPDAVSRASVLLEEAPRRRLIEQLETATHPTAIAAREAVAARNIDKEADPSRYEDELIAYAINHAIESGGRSWAPIRGVVSAARRKWKEFTGDDNLNLDDLGHYARATVNALAESEAGINAPGVAGREQVAMHGTPSTFAPEEGAPLGRMRSDKALTGEGAQAYGAGHYLTQQWDTAENRYRTRLSEDRGAQPSREKALAEAIESSRWAVESPSDLTAEDVVDRLRYLDQHWTSERNRMQSVVDNSADALDRGYYETRVAEIAEDLAAIRSALELAENSDLRQMMEMADDSRDGDVGEVYYADIPEDSELMHWQEPVSARSQELQDALLSIDPDANLEQPFASWYIQRSQSKGLGRSAGDRAVSNELAAAGIKGHIFSGRMDGERNFVVYSDEDVGIGGRDRRELGETRREMEAFGEEIQSRPTSSRTLREEFETEARERAAADRSVRPRTELELAPFEGRAQEPAAARPAEAAASQARGPYVSSTFDTAASTLRNAFTVDGTVSEDVGSIFREANYARDAVLQQAVYNYHRVGPAMEKAAAKAMANEQGTAREKLQAFNDRILGRLRSIAELPSDAVKDKALARMVQEYPDLAPLVDAIQDINQMTENIIADRFSYADTRPLSEQEWILYDYMHRNKYGYLTNVYALFQGKDGKEYADAVLRAGAQGLKHLRSGEQIPDNIRQLYQVYDDALSFVLQNDVAVNSPEQLAAMNIKDVAALYDRWQPDGMRAADLAITFREGNNGDLDTASYKAYMEDAVAEYVSMLKDPEYVAEDGTTGADRLRNEADAVVAALLRQDETTLTGPMRRYGRARGIDTSILEHRQDLPAAIANLYGQVRDIPSLINATLSRQGELSSRIQFFNNLAEEAYGDAVVSAADRNLVGNEDFTILLSGPSYGRLNGMYTTKDVAQRLADYGTMFTDLVDTLAIVGVNPTIGRRWAEHKLGKAWTTAAGAQKAMKIVTRPDYLLMNLLGSFSAPVLTGGVKPAHLLTGMKVALEHIALQIDPKGRAIGPELSAAHQLALQTGAFDNAVTQELRRAPRKLVNRLLEEMTAVDNMGEAMTLLKRAYNWSNDRGWQTLVESYSLMDTWVKLPVLLERMDYLESYYAANGDSVTNDQIQREAARYMRDATISMEMVPGGAKFLERAGLSFYLPYFASVFRVLHKSNVHIVDSIEMAVNAKTPEAKWVATKDVARKTAGVAAVWIAALQGLKYVAELGMDEDDMEQMERDRELMFDEPKYGDLRYLGTNDQGHRQYMLVSRTDQFGPAFDIARRLQRAESMDEAAKAIPQSIWDLWVANRMILATVDHVARGGKNTQLERTFPRATEFFKTQANRVPGGYTAMDFLMTQADLVSPAGVINYFDPRNKTPTEVEDDAAAIISSIAAATGHRLVTVNPESAIMGKAGELARHRREANGRIRDSVTNLGPMGGFETFSREAKRERALAEELGKMYHAMLDSGMSHRELAGYMESLDATSIRNIRNRAYTSEANRWIKERSGLLSSNSINNPATNTDLPAEERKEMEREWKRQAKEVKRMVRAMTLEENN